MKYIFNVHCSLRDTCRQTALKHFPDHWKNRRVEFIPIEWRTWLTLDQGAVVWHHYTFFREIPCTIVYRVLNGPIF